MHTKLARYCWAGADADGEPGGATSSACMRQLEQVPSAAHKQP